ncbi:MAG TPA: RNA polymerase sigma factor ShbA [Streptosporangiaceae bacterium]|jgi:RNA polymerase sigma-70 factor (ECF subfamily)
MNGAEAAIGYEPSPHSRAPDGVRNDARARAGKAPDEPADDELKRLAFAARDGDSAATETLIALLRPLILRYCRARLGRIVGGYHTADDVAQEACVGVLKALPRYEDMGKPFAAFAIRIAANKVADAQRRAFTVGIPLDDLTDRPDDRAGPEEQAVQVDEAARAHALLNRLPELHREIVLLRVVVGLSAKETGQIFDLTASAVRLIQHRALIRVRGMATGRGSR